MYAKLGPRNKVIAVHRARAVTTGKGVLAIHHPINIFTLWSDDELNAIGYARFTEIPPVEGTISISEVDSMVDGQIVRTHNTVPDPDHLNKRKLEVALDVKLKRDQVINSGIAWLTEVSPNLDSIGSRVQDDPGGGIDSDSIRYGYSLGHEIQTDSDSRHHISDVAFWMIQRGDVNVTKTWRRANNTVFTFSFSDFTAMASAIEKYTADCYDQQAVFELMIESAIDIDDLDVIDITTGWPDRNINRVAE